MDQKSEIFKNEKQFFFLSHEVEYSFFPVIVGYERCSAEKEVINTRNKIYYLLHFVINGSGILSINNKSYTIEKNQMFYTPPHSNASYKPVCSDPWEYMWVEIDGVNSQTFCEQAGLSPDTPVLTPQKPQQIFDLFLSFLKINARTVPENSPLNTAVLLNIFAKLIKNKQDTRLDSAPNQLKIHSILDYIHTHYCEPDLSLQAIADRAHFNKSYFCRLFKSLLGVSPQQYIIDLRMKKAQDMIRLSTYSIAEISLAVGYKSPYFFSKEFKRLFGASPLQYRHISKSHF